MPISLPSSPTVGQTYTLGGKIWTWNGYAWKLPSTTGVLPVLYGGTGVTTSTGTGNNVLSASPTFTGTVNTAAITASVFVYSTTSGFKFPDATIQTTAATGAPTLVIVTATTQTAVKGNHYVLTNVAATTLTLPADPTAGDLVYVTSANSLATNVVARSPIAGVVTSSRIMGLIEDLTINTTAYITLQLRYINATIGWVTL